MLRNTRHKRKKQDNEYLGKKDDEDHADIINEEDQNHKYWRIIIWGFPLI